MPVIPHRPQLFQSCKELYQFLAFCQQQSIRDRTSKIASISTAIDPVDPLVALDHFAHPDQLHFYFENPRRQEAIAAIDTAISHAGNGSPKTCDRGKQAQEFLQTCQQQMIVHGRSDLPFSGPHFFGGFTFFDSPIRSAFLDNQLLDNQFDDHLNNQLNISPFPAATLFLPRWQIVRHRHAGLLVTNAVINTCIDIAELADSIWQQWQQIQSLAYLGLPSVKRRPRSLKQQPVTSARRFKQSVQAALKRIEAQQLHKIVLAQALDVTAADEFAIAPSLHHLRQRYAGCYLFAMGNGRGQTFMGASPERLISIRCGELVTDALAGSAPRGKTAAQDLALANRLQLSEKERHEHRVVADFITQQLLEIGLQPLSATVPQLLRLSNIQHLHTPIRAKLPASVHPLDVLMALHPTPAVAGVPCQQACEAILEYEAFERSLYAAPLGWLDHRGNSEFIVGIRSALITANHARLYAGAGIVAGSDPARELAEIQLKLTALLNALV